MTQDHPTGYQQLVENMRPPEPGKLTCEDELDALVDLHKSRQEERKKPVMQEEDPIHKLRELTINELVPLFLDLADKYRSKGITMDMDASNFIQGGREMRFEFRFAGHWVQLNGTVTAEAIAFQETRHAPSLPGELVSGPMLRIRSLDDETFREFICSRLTIMIRDALRRRY